MTLAQSLSYSIYRDSSTQKHSELSRLSVLSQVGLALIIYLATGRCRLQSLFEYFTDSNFLQHISTTKLLTALK